MPDPAIHPAGGLSMTTIHDLLAEYTRIAPNTRAKGLYFERLAKRYLETEPIYTGLFDAVWLWQDWPGRGGKVDTGIDLVARERYSGTLWAIQCKFYDPSHTVQKGEIDSFFEASGKAPFGKALVITTTDKWSKHALEALSDRHVPTQRIGLTHLAESVIDWSQYRFDAPDAAPVVERKRLREHQIDALQDTLTGFDEHDRGQLIMACGTGKTFTGLRIAERVAGPGGRVLFLVPSIALLAQTLREWTQQADLPLRSFAICSDAKVGRNNEDLRLRDLEIAATTNAEQLLEALATPTEPGGLTVFFSTYQSLPVVHEAQQAGIGDFDLVLCDEAHRTAGVIHSQEELVSNFVRVHDADFIRSDKRLYMTATPKLYGEAAKKKADAESVEIASMDRPEVFGPEFHRLGFGKAVEQNLLTDYKVLVLAVSEDAVNEGFQKQFAAEGSELTLPDAARVAGIYKALAKTAVEGLDANPAAQAPMRRAVAFASDIKSSKHVAAMLDENAALSRAVPTKDADLVMQAKHVDGTMDILQRGELLSWLEDDPKGNRTRILTNARCLTEGVDVPSLDAVIFLNPRGSQVDVVQAVGRVMRRSPGKDYGYIILPVAVPAGMTPEEALDDNERFRVIWEVLQALRAHDERFAATIEAIRLNPKAGNEQIQVIAMERWLPSGESDAAAAESGEAATAQARLDFTPLGPEWDDAIYARIVKKVGEREYWENWAADVAEVANRQRARIEVLVDARPGIRREFDRFVKGLRANLNDSITDDDALDMLAQHIITEPVLEILFEGYSFAESNPVASSMQRMLASLEGTNVDSELRELDDFYAGVKRSVGQITDAQGKQRFLKQLYERFFRIAMRKASERLGIVYTPNEIVDFILRSADELSREHFGKGLADDGVHILDPFTGTGTFLAQLILNPELMPNDKLPHKFRNELWANEISLLAYYVAAVNLEQAYRSRMGGNYVSFPGIALTDTFQNTEDGDQLDAEGVFETNNEVVVRESAAPISVIIGNPPYSKGQTSGNDDNQNLSYPTLDSLIRRDYADRSSAKNKNNLYDSYIRAIKWASERIGKRGIVVYVTNNGYLDSNAADGLRRGLRAEFTDIYVVNLRGNSRVGREQAKQEGENVFDVRVGIAVVAFVRNPARPGSRVHYAETPDASRRNEKYHLLREWRHAAGANPRELTPNAAEDWINQRTDAFLDYQPLARRMDGPTEVAVLRNYSAGVKSGRDWWVYGSSKSTTIALAEKFIAFYNEQLADRARSIRSGRSWARDNDKTKISWITADTADLAKGKRRELREPPRRATYRVFTPQYLAFQSELLERAYQSSSIFPTSTAENHGFYYVGAGSAVPFSVLMLDSLPDLHVTGAGSGGQFFPRYWFEKREVDDGQLDVFGTEEGDEYIRHDNVTDEILADYRIRYADQGITKDDIFHFVYGVLHSPEYRDRFAADLKRTLPRIPQVGDFWAFAHAGKELAELHLNYESAELYPLGGVPEGDEHLRVEKKMSYGGKRGVDKTTLHYNEHVTLTGIPERAHEYKLGSRSAIDWVVDRYYVRIDKASGIVNDANAWGEEHGNPRYILELVQRLVTVSLRTVDIVESLPPLNIPEGEISRVR
jgi:predicted helicase